MFGRSALLIANLSLALGTLLAFSGCPTPPKPSPHVTALEPTPRNTPLAPAIEHPTAAPSGAGHPAFPDGGLQTVVVPPVVAPNVALRDHAESVLPEERFSLPHGKLPLSSWAQLCGFSEIRSAPNANPPLLELTGPGGNLTLMIGQRFAKWNGINLGLAYPPVPERGQVLVHSIDVEKNFYPLALGNLTLARQTRVLVIDPGHGGADPGSRATTRKALEKDLSLDWALRVERMLANTVWKVILTRRDDRDTPLLERVAIADANRADLFISLHFNSLENSGNGKPDETGIETYCLTPAGAPSNVTRNFEDDMRRVYPNNEFDAQNLLLAARMQSSLISTTGRRDRGVRRARFMTVVREQKRPAVLVEGGFLSNPTEASLILQPEFRDQMARAVCNALPN